MTAFLATRLSARPRPGCPLKGYGGEHVHLLERELFHPQLLIGGALTNCFSLCCARVLPKLAKPEPNRDSGRTAASAVRAILDGPPIHIRPDVPAARVQSKQTLWVYAIPAHL